MKKVFAVLMTLLLVLSFAACGEGNDPTRSHEELISEANEAAVSLLEYKEELDKQLVLVNSADNNDKFFDLTEMILVAAQLKTLTEELGGTDGITDGEKAAEAQQKVLEIDDKIKTAAVKYAKQFKAMYPDAELTKIYCLTVFMSGEPSSFFAADFKTADGTEKTVYSISSFTAGTPEDVLTSVRQNLFSEKPVAARDATKYGNVSIDLNAVLAALAEEQSLETESEEISEEIGVQASEAAIENESETA